MLCGQPKKAFSIELIPSALTSVAVETKARSALAWRRSFRKKATGKCSARHSADVDHTTSDPAGSESLAARVGPCAPKPLQFTVVSVLSQEHSWDASQPAR